MEASAAGLIRQHLIDPEICIRCNTCESTCPVGAISHDARNYVVDANICNLCMACVPPCPTGSIDNWRAMPRARAYSVEDAVRLGRPAGRTERRRPGSRRRRGGRFRCRRAGPGLARRPGQSGVRRRRLCRRRPAMVGRTRDCESLWTESGGEVGFRHGRRQCAGDGTSARTTTPITSCSISAP